MKTAKEINIEINRIISLTGRSDKELKKDRKEVAFLKDCLFYIEKNPSESFVKKQFDYTRDEMTRIDEGFETWLSFNSNRRDVASVDNKLAKYKSEFGYNNLRKQRDRLMYILS